MNSVEHISEKKMNEISTETTKKELANLNMPKMKFKRKYDNFDDSILSSSESDIVSDDETKFRLTRKPNVKKDSSMTFYLLQKNDLLNSNHIESLRKIEKLKSEINMIEQKEYYLKLDLNNASLKVEKYKMKYEKVVCEKTHFQYWNAFFIFSFGVSMYVQFYLL